jgi:hypothetical protein
MTAAGVLRTTLLDTGRDVVGDRSQGGGAQTSSSTGGPVWVKPDWGHAQEGGAKTSSSTGGPTWVGPVSANAGPMQRAAPGRRAPELLTRVTAAGVLRTVVIDTLVGSEATGYSWIRRVKENGATSGAGASSGTGPQEVSPMAARSVEPAGAYRTTAPETAPAVNDLAAPLNRGGAANSLGATSTEGNVRVLPTGHADPVSTATEGPDGGADPPIAKGQMSVQSRRALSCPRQCYRRLIECMRRSGSLSRPSFRWRLDRTIPS